VFDSPMSNRAPVVVPYVADYLGLAHHVQFSCVPFRDGSMRRVISVFLEGRKEGRKEGIIVK
jgi:hypothetical protein